MTDMIEQMARAAMDATCGDGEWGCSDDGRREIYRSEVRAALRRLLSPTPEMVEAGKVASVVHNFDPRAVFQAMIKAALKE